MLMSHESLVSYYQTNVNMFVYSSDIGLVNNFTLGDFDNMLPWQRDIYIMLISDRMKQHIEMKQKSQSK